MYYNNPVQRAPNESLIRCPLLSPADMDITTQDTSSLLPHIPNAFAYTQTLSVLSVLVPGQPPQPFQPGHSPSPRSKAGGGAGDHLCQGRGPHMGPPGQLPSAGELLCHSSAFSTLQPRASWHLPVLLLWPSALCGPGSGSGTPASKPLVLLSCRLPGATFCSLPGVLQSPWHRATLP